jgi:hypothetical protein
MVNLVILHYKFSGLLTFLKNLSVLPKKNDQTVSVRQDESLPDLFYDFLIV